MQSGGEHAVDMIRNYFNSEFDYAPKNQVWQPHPLYLLSFYDFHYMRVLLPKK